MHSAEASALTAAACGAIRPPRRATACTTSGTPCPAPDGIEETVPSRVRTPRPPAGVRRWALRRPILLFRLHLDRLLGERIALRHPRTARRPMRMCGLEPASPEAARRRPPVGPRPRRSTSRPGT